MYIVDGVGLQCRQYIIKCIKRITKQLNPYQFTNLSLALNMDYFVTWAKMVVSLENGVHNSS